MKAKLNDIVVVEWDDELPEKAIIVKGDHFKRHPDERAFHFGYEAFFPGRRNDRVQSIGKNQIIAVIGHVDENKLGR